MSISWFRTGQRNNPLDGLYHARFRQRSRGGWIVHHSRVLVEPLEAFGD